MSVFRVWHPAVPGHALTSSTVLTLRCCPWWPSRFSPSREVKGDTCSSCLCCYLSRETAFLLSLLLPLLLRLMLLSAFCLVFFFGGGGVVFLCALWFFLMWHQQNLTFTGLKKKLFFQLRLELRLTDCIKICCGSCQILTHKKKVNRQANHKDGGCIFSFNQCTKEKKRETKEEYVAFVGFIYLVFARAPGES